MTTTATGEQFEQLAMEHLQQQGLQCLRRNFRSRQGEIDLVMQDRRHLVFVEVRYRRSGHFGGATASITASKRQRLIRTAEYYLSRFGMPASALGCRFDVVAITGQHAPWQIDWIPAAFSVE